MNLFEKTRGFLCYLTPEKKVDYPCFVLRLSERMESNVYAIRKEGRVEGRTQRSEIDYDPYAQFLFARFSICPFYTPPVVDHTAMHGWGRRIVQAAGVARLVCGRAFPFGAGLLGKRGALGTADFLSTLAFYRG